MKKNQKGTILLFVVIIVGIIGMLYTSIYFLISSERKIHQSLQYRTKAYYIAESGLEKAYAVIRANDDIDIPTEIPLDNPFSAQYKDDHKILVTIEKTAPTYKIISEGTYKNTKRKLEAEVFKQDSDFAVQYWKEID